MPIVMSQIYDADFVQKLDKVAKTTALKYAILQDICTPLNVIFIQIYT